MLQEIHPTNSGQNFGTGTADFVNIGSAGVNIGFGFTKLILNGKSELFMSALTPLNVGSDGFPMRSVDKLDIVTDEAGKEFEVGVTSRIEPGSEIHPIRG